MKKFIIICCFLPAFIFSCHKQTDTFFKLEPVYDSIRSCPSCGGVFIISLSDNLSGSENIQLSVEASSDLNTSLTKTVINKESPITEVVIKPNENIQTGNYIIKLNAFDEDYNTTINLFVTVYDWSSEINENSLNKKEEYISWLQDNFPELEINPASQWFAYPTYPQILIVEHYTFLNDKYEFRICLHAMIPPDDWSMIRLRKRNKINPFLAVRQDSTGGEYYQIPVEDYPVITNY